MNTAAGSNNSSFAKLPIDRLNEIILTPYHTDKQLKYFVGELSEEEWNHIVKQLPENPFLGKLNDLRRGYLGTGKNTICSKASEKKATLSTKQEAEPVKRQLTETEMHFHKVLSDFAKAREINLEKEYIKKLSDEDHQYLQQNITHHFRPWISQLRN